MNEIAKSQPLRIDELARRTAVTYAASTLHFVRRTTHDTNALDPSDSFLQEVQSYHGHPGKPPIKADKVAQEFLNAVIAESPPDPRLGSVVILGEEVSHSDWRPSPNGNVIVRCDPVDGTSNLSHCGDGFSTVVTIERLAPGQSEWEHLAGAIVRNDGDGISWSRHSVYRYDVVIDFHALKPSDTPQILHREQLPPFRSWSIDPAFADKLVRSGATVAAHSSKRRTTLFADYPRLITQPEFFDFRSGSTSAWGLCNRRLGFVFELNPTTIHDSAHLFPFSILLGGHVVDHEFRPLDIRKIIESNAGPKTDDKVVPPYIAYVDERSLPFLKDCLSSEPPPPSDA